MKKFLKFLSILAICLLITACKSKEINVESIEDKPEITGIVIKEGTGGDKVFGSTGEITHIKPGDSLSINDTPSNDLSINKDYLDKGYISGNPTLEQDILANGGGSGIFYEVELPEETENNRLALEDGARKQEEKVKEHAKEDFAIAEETRVQQEIQEEHQATLSLQIACMDYASQVTESSITIYDDEGNLKYQQLTLFFAGSLNEFAVPVLIDTEGKVYLALCEEEYTLYTEENVIYCSRHGDASKCHLVEIIQQNGYVGRESLNAIYLRYVLPLIKKGVLR